MSFELLVAIRYLKAKRKHAAISVITLVSIAGVAAGVAALVVALAINEGFREDLQDKLLGTTQAHVTLLPKKGKGIENFMEVATAVEKMEGVAATSPALYDTVLISSAAARRGVTVKGIIAERDARISDLAKTLGKGGTEENDVRTTMQEFNEPVKDGHRPPILIGRALSNALGTSVGDPIQLLSAETEPSPIGPRLRPFNFEIAGIFDSGLYEHDSGWVYIPMETAQRMLRLDFPPMAMAVEIKLRDLYDAPKAGARIAKATGLDATNWIEMNTKIFQALKLERLVMLITIGLIVMVAALNIVGSLTMMVLEKSRDIAILMAMGATRQTIRRIFIWQGVVIGVVGTVIGLGLGHLLSFLADYYQWVRIDEEVYSIAYVPFRTNALDSVVIAVVAIAISYLATLYPSAEAAKLEPVETLRYE